ncbi:phosphatidylinositol-specific phospholipase C1-like protein [Terriglobus tenax]|uniref:phosphatidylinositol-specific phospholipase C1-like protein n=1 Tax=Terriglobus tenax TaxID=1111115 RepID=UPI0021E00C56|nr:phosphatidylinositol-specific phospholipase C1-like protein [Terriglobus tenax]
MRMLLPLALMVCVLPALAQNDLRLNQIQVVGTHNSYQMPADPRVMQVMGPRLKPMIEGMMQHMPAEQAAAMKEEHPNPLADAFADGLDYIQAPLEMQLRAGVRSLELDLQADPKGGLYADPLPYRELRAKGETDLAPIYEEQLEQPGMKVFHMADIDFRSQCPRFQQCLKLLRQWSDANPGHSPVFILLEPKLSGLEKVVPGAVTVGAFDKAAFDEVDTEIVRVMGRERLFTPDDLRGTHATVEEAALAKAWPKVSETRGKFLFLFLVPGLNFKAFAPYLEGHENLEGRAAFVQGLPGMKHTAFVMVDNATIKPGRVEELVRKGYFVRSRADIDTYEARKNDTTRREGTLRSGAQIISTDYPLEPNIYGNTYQVKPFTDGFRCNPVTASCK